MAVQSKSRTSFCTVQFLNIGFLILGAGGGVGRVWRRGRKGVGLGIRLQRQRHSDTDSIPLGGFKHRADYCISRIMKHHDFHRESNVV